MKMQWSGWRIAIAAGLALAVAALTLLARTSVPLTALFLGNLELRFVDARFLARGPLPEPDLKRIGQQIAIVALDDSATRRFGTVLPRAVHARLVRQLKKAGAQAVIFDIIFADPDRNNPANDRQFAQACAAAQNVFLPFDDDSSQPTPPALLKRLEAKLSYPLAAPKAAQVIRVQPPVEPLLETMRGGGHVAIKRDSDAKFRSVILLMEAGAVYPHLVLDAVARQSWKLSPKQAPVKLGEGFVQIGSHRLAPLTPGPLIRSVYDASQQQAVLRRAGTMWTIPLNFIGGHDVMQSFTVPYLEALEGRADQRLKGRIVIVGETATGTKDLRASPFDRQEVFLGVETNATFLANLLDDNFLRYAPPLWAVLATLACGLVSGLMAFALRPGLALLLSASVAVTYGTAAVLFFTSDDLVLEMAAPLLAVFLSYTVLTAYRLVFVDRAAREYESALRETQTMLGQYVNERLAQELFNNPETRRALQIGTRREVTVLFSDIRAFTSWSENQPPEEVKTRLDEYFSVMCEIVSDDYNGYIDKFIGDELMVVWNGVYEQPDHAERAVRAALSMHRALDMLNNGWRKQKQQEFRIGIGIASGNAVFGTFGSPKHKLMPTVLGDTVNLASRLSAMTKDTGSKIIIAEATYQAVQREFEVKPLGTIPIRGKSEAQAMYEVVGVME